MCNVLLSPVRLNSVPVQKDLIVLICQELFLLIHHGMSGVTIIADVISLFKVLFSSSLDLILLMLQENGIQQGHDGFPCGFLEQ